MESELLNESPDRFTPEKKHPVLAGRKDGWASNLIWSGWKREKSVPGYPAYLIMKQLLNILQGIRNVKS
jgi:hypothetical protein